MEDAGRDGVERRVGGSDAEDIGVGDRLGAEAGPHRVADHAADAGVGPAVGVDGRGVVVRLDLEADVDIVVEADDAGVVLEDRDEPGGVEHRGRREDRPLQEVVDDLPLKLDAPPERLVRAVLAPGLGEGLQLAVGRVASLGFEVVADRPHLVDRERKLPLPARPEEVDVPHASDRDLDPFEGVRASLAEPIEAERPPDDLLDGIVGQDAVDQTWQGLGRPFDVVGPDRTDFGDPEAEILEDRPGALGHRIGHAGPWQDVDEDRAAGLGLVGVRAAGVNVERLDDRVGEHGLGGASEVIGPEGPLDQKSAGRSDRPRAVQAEVDGLGRHPTAFEVGQAGCGIDSEVPEHEMVDINGMLRDVSVGDASDGCVRRSASEHGAGQSGATNGKYPQRGSLASRT